MIIEPATASEEATSTELGRVRSPRRVAIVIAIASVVSGLAIWGVYGLIVPQENPPIASEISCEPIPSECLRRLQAGRTVGPLWPEQTPIGLRQTSAALTAVGGADPMIVVQLQRSFAETQAITLLIAPRGGDRAEPPKAESAYSVTPAGRLVATVPRKGAVRTLYFWDEAYLYSIVLDLDSTRRFAPDHPLYGLGMDLIDSLEPHVQWE